MNQINKSIIAALVSLSGLGSVAAEISIIPQPLEMRDTEVEYILNSNTKILYGALGEPSAKFLANKLTASTGMQFQLSNNSADSANAIVFQKVLDTSLGDEGYRLSVKNNQVLISAQTETGLFYGMQTLRQLLPTENFASTKQDGVKWIVDGADIKDVPKYKWRGLMLDVSRHFMPKQDVKKFMDTMAVHKLNSFHMHLTDDQGWRIEIKKWPKLTEVGAWRPFTQVGTRKQYKKTQQNDGTRHGGYYSHDDIRELVKYAAERHINIVPEIDMPGHMQAAIAAYPELGSGHEKVGVRCEWGISQQILNPKDSTIEFCKDVLTEVMELFPSEYIHIGGDEAKKNLWEKNPEIQALYKERKVADSHEMQSWFISQLDTFLVSKGRRLIGWNEIVEGGLADNAAVMWWQGKAKQQEQIAHVIEAAKAGHEIVAASNENLYFDFYQSKDKANEPLAYGGFLPLETVYAFNPKDKFKGHADAANMIIGVQAQLWAEYMPNLAQVEYMAYPRSCALAELAWLPAGQKNYDSFKSRLQTHTKRLEQLGVNFRKGK